MQGTWKPTKRKCTNCGQTIVGCRNDKGTVRLQCPKCGLIMISIKISRRHERIEITPPKGEYIDS